MLRLATRGAAVAVVALAGLSVSWPSSVAAQTPTRHECESVSPFPSNWATSGDGAYTSTSGASMTFAVTVPTGESATSELLVWMGPSEGTFSWSLDGGAPTALDAFSATEDGYQSFPGPALDEGSHDVTLTNTSTAFLSCDALVTTSAPVSSTTSTSEPPPSSTSTTTPPGPCGTTSAPCFVELNDSPELRVTLQALGLTCGLLSAAFLFRAKG